MLYQYILLEMVTYYPDANVAMLWDVSAHHDSLKTISEVNSSIEGVVSMSDKKSNNAELECESYDSNYKVYQDEKNVCVTGLPNSDGRA